MCCVFECLQGPTNHVSEQSLADEKLVTCGCHQTMKLSELIQVFHLLNVYCIIQAIEDC